MTVWCLSVSNNAADTRESECVCFVHAVSHNLKWKCQTEEGKAFDGSHMHYFHCAHHFLSKPDVLNRTNKPKSLCQAQCCYITSAAIKDQFEYECQWSWWGTQHCFCLSFHTSFDVCCYFSERFLPGWQRKKELPPGVF